MFKLCRNYDTSSELEYNIMPALSSIDYFLKKKEEKGFEHSLGNDFTSLGCSLVQILFHADNTAQEHK